jgi:hypothetical protein
MPFRLATVLVMAAALRGCVTYEYEQEFWLKVDGSGTVYVTGRPDLWAAFKGLRAGDPEGKATRDAAHALFERAGLQVNRVLLTRRGGRAYLFVSADFEDVNRLSGSPAFPELTISLRHEGERLRLQGRWQRPPSGEDGAAARDGLMAVRFHLPSKIYEHKNAADGVERGNIVGWRQDVAAAFAGEPLEFAVVMDDRSILFSTVTLFACTVVAALAILALAFTLIARKGRKALVRAGGPPSRVR